jgi:hypothetical protein
MVPTGPRLAALAFGLSWILLAAPRGAAQEGLFLTWNECAFAPTSPHTLTFACDANSGDHRLYCAFQVAEPIDSVLGVEVVVDLAAAGDSLPAWWRFDNSGCRPGVLKSDQDFPSPGACLNPWQGGAGGLLSYTPAMPRGGGNQARMRMAFAMPSEQVITLTPGSQYYAVRIVVENAATVGGSACLHCQTSVCLVLNGIILKRPGTVTGDHLLQIGGPGLAHHASWQASVPGDCNAVPVRPRTWGAIKALYR